MWPFTRRGKAVRSVSDGGLPRVRLPASIRAYAMDGSQLRMTLVIGGKFTIVCAVPEAVPGVLPVGSKVELVMERVE